MGEREGGVFLVRDSATIQVRMIIVIGKILVMDVIVMMIMMTSPS